MNIGLRVQETSGPQPWPTRIRALVVTPEWPSDAYPAAGSFVADQVDSIRAQGHSVDVMFFRGRGSVFEYIRAHMALRQRLRGGDYDIVHAHFGQAGLIAVLQRRLPVVVTFHGSDIYGLPATSVISVLRSCLLRVASHLAAIGAKQVIAVSDRLALRIRRRDVHVIPLAVSSYFRKLSRGPAREILGWPSGERSVLFVGDPRNEIKRFALAKEAVSLLPQEWNNIRIRICWNEPLHRVPVYMNAADVLLVTSIHEGGPLVVPEALLCGLPVVTVNVGNVQHWLANISDCFICIDDNAETIAAALRRVLEKHTRIAVPPIWTDGAQDVANKVIGVYRLAIGQSLAS